MADQDPLSDLESLVKTHFGDLLVSMSVAANGSLFLSIWQQPVEGTSLYMKHLPLFYIVAYLDDESKFCLKIISYHGKVIEHLEDDEKTQISEKDKIQFVDKLTRITLCNGIKMPDNELQLDAQTFSFLYMVEQLDENVIIRSRQCRVGIYDNHHQQSCCESCMALNKENEKTHKPNKLEFNDEDEFGLMNEDISETFNDLADVKPFFTKQVKVEEGEEDDSNSECFDPEGLDNRLYDDADPDDDIDVENHVNGFSKECSKSESQDHNVSNFRDIRPFFCDQCKQTFVSRSELKGHLDYNNHKSQLSSKCFLCRKVFHDDLRFHLWQEHWDVAPFKCKLCDFVAVRPSQVSAHCRKIHNRSTNIDSDIEPSDEAFRLIQSAEKQYNLKFEPDVADFFPSSHYSSSTAHFDNNYETYYYKDFGKDLKPFFCEECEETFSSAKDLNSHCISKFHTSRIQATCFICHDTFSRADKSLRIHIYSNHLRLKPFKCKLCPFTSYTKHKIESIHSKRHHETRSDDASSNIEYLEGVMMLIDDFELNHGLQLGTPMLEKLKSGKILNPLRKRRKICE